MLKPRSSFISTTRRTYATRRAEKPPARFPDPLKNSPNATVTTLEKSNLTFIHRPPPTAPSPHSTTLSPASPLLRPPTPTGGPIPPMLRPSSYKPEPERLSAEDLEKMRELRLQDPSTYTRSKLAKMFNCSPNLVYKVAALPKTQRKELAKKQETEHTRIRAGWGEKKATFVAIRQKRREYW
ncbi:mitochondrial ribosomal protein subunit L20-domain-containing protein [Phlebopus sp. FC_14]|nr:mitochondrial ribosomal protein subunit L20-domain-containing protein [Phlebopus sp. FC_14]